MPCGRPPRNLASHEQALLTRLGAEPDATLAELRDWLAAERPVPYGHWTTTTFVAGLRCDGLTAPFVIDGPINGEWFYVEKVLAPTLRPGTLVPQRIGDLDIPRWREATGQDALRQVASVMSEPTARGSKLWLFR